MPEPIVCRREGCNNRYRGHAEDDAQLAQQARAAGWRLGTRADGTPDAMCARCAKPDPELVKLCRDLAGSLKTSQEGML